MIAALYATVFALALAASPAWAGGWYLLTPLVRTDHTGRAWFDDGAPLNEWEHEGAYDSAKECEAVTLKKRVKVEGRWVTVAPGERHSRCIATDDPRLTVDQCGVKGSGR